jgi:hypothetical protein
MMSAKVGRCLFDEEVAAILTLVSPIDPTDTGQNFGKGRYRAWGVHANSYVNDRLRIQAPHGGTAHMLYVSHEIGGVVEDASPFSLEVIVPPVFVRHDLNRSSLEPEHYLLEAWW